MAQAQIAIKRRWAVGGYCRGWAAFSLAVSIAPDVLAASAQQPAGVLDVFAFVLVARA